MLKILSKQKEKSCTVGLNRVLDWTPQVTHDHDDAGDVVDALRLDGVLVLFLLMAFLVGFFLTVLLVLLALTMLSELLLIMDNIVSSSPVLLFSPGTLLPRARLRG